MTILSALNSLYGRMAEAGEAPRRGYSTEKIGGEVVIDRDGNLVAINPKLVADGKRMVAAQIAVPAPPLDRRGKKIVSGFLWDPAPYALGVSLDADKTLSLTAERAAEKHAVFKGFHQEILKDSDDPGLQAFRQFLARWEPKALFVLPGIADIVAGNVVFRVEDDTAAPRSRRFLHDSPAAVSVWDKHLSGPAQGNEQICLVTGNRAPAARLHPSFTGLGKGAQSSGAYLVSFNIGSKDVRGASSSYGKEQGDNAPVSEAAAFAYGTALNALLARSGAGPSRRALRIGDTTVVFWAETPDREQDEEAEDWMAGLLDPPDGEPVEDQADAAEKLRLTLEAVGRGQAPDDPRFHPETRVYVLGLAPNAARLSVRFWIPGTLGDFTRHVLRFHEDLRLEPPAWKRAPSVRAVVRQCARIYVGANGRKQYDEATIPPRLAGELMQSVVSGLPFPQTLLSGIIGRIRADGEVTPGRAAICKAFLKRNSGKRENKMSLDKASDDIAYVLGRLFAAYAYAEQSFAKRNSTIRDRYLAGASANPAGVFPLLMRGYEHNRSGLLKSDGQKRGSGIKADRAVSEILDRIQGAGGFPAMLTMDDQARFFIGFYHQFNSFFATPEVAADEAATDADSEDTE